MRNIYGLWEAIQLDRKHANYNINLEQKMLCTTFVDSAGVSNLVENIFTINYVDLVWEWPPLVGFSRVLHTTWCKPHVGPTQETTWLLSAYGTSGQPGEAKPNSSQAQTKPPRYSRCCRKLLFEEVELLLGWLVGISMWIATLALMPSHVPEISAIPTWWSFLWNVGMLQVERLRLTRKVVYVERGSFWTAHHLHIFPCALD